MKKYYIIAAILLSLGILTACSDDERSTDFINDIAVPKDVNVVSLLSDDNSGTVTFTPSGTSTSYFTFNFGDGSEEETIIAGESISHVFGEGNQTITVTAYNAIGKGVEVSTDVLVTFLPPENLEFSISSVPGNSFAVEVSATADFATNYDVYFGEEPNETPVNVVSGSSATYVYDVVGNYTIRVVAKNGGSETIEATQTVTIENPIILPLTFEDTTQEYVIVGFEGADSEIIDNPVSGGENTSTRVVRTTKTDGSQFFAGTFTDVDLPIDFSTSGRLSIKSYSPKANIPVRIRLENNGNTVSAEVDVNTTVENEWETLVFDFSSQLNPDAEYIRIVIFYEFVPDLPGDGTTYYFDDIQVEN